MEILFRSQVVEVSLWDPPFPNRLRLIWITTMIDILCMISLALKLYCIQKLICQMETRSEF